MADFFSRLAERTLGVAAVVKPVIAPLFAPGPQLVAESVAVAPQASQATDRRQPIPANAVVAVQYSGLPLAVPAAGDVA